MHQAHMSNRFDKLLRRSVSSLAITVMILQSAAWTSEAFGQAAPPTSAADNAMAPVADDDTRGEIIVTAQRRRQNLQDVPASVAAVSGDLLAQRSIVSVNQLSAVVSNLQISDPYGPGAPPTFTMRGIASADFSLNQSRPIAVYLDEGIRQLPSFEAVPLFDIEQIEALRGPQGVLYGKNATGGAINIASRKPGFETSGKITAGYGNFNRRESEGAIQFPIVDEKIAVRLAYTFTKDDGAIKNLFPGTPDVEQTDVFGLRGTLLIKPTDDLELIVRYLHARSSGRNGGVYADNIDFVAAGFPELASVPGNSRQGLGFFSNRQNTIGHRIVATDGVNTQINWKISDAFNLASVTTYDTGKWIETQDTDGLPIDQEFDIDKSDNQRQFVEELRLTGKVGAAHLLLGAFYSHDKTDVSYQYKSFFDLACTLSCGSDILGGFTDGSYGRVLANSFKQKRDSYSVYGRLEYDLTSRLALSGGLRWSRDRVAVQNYQAFFGDIDFPDSIQTIAPTDYTKTFNKLSGEAVVTWKPHRHLTTYASFKQGYRTGAVNSQAFSDVSEVSAAPPETADSWEVGAKMQPFGTLLTLNMAGFYAKYHNQQVTSSELLNGFIIYPLRSVDRSRIYGMEADATLRPSQSLTFSASLGYSNAVYTKGIVAGDDVSGNQLTNAAKWSGNASVDWKAAQIGNGTLIFRADANFQSKAYFDTHQTASTTDDGHTVANTSLSYETPVWSLTAWTTNVFNTHYFTYAIDLSSEGFVYKIRGAPRKFGARVALRF